MADMEFLVAIQAVMECFLARGAFQGARVLVGGGGTHLVLKCSVFYALLRKRGTGEVSIKSSLYINFVPSPVFITLPLFLSLADYLVHPFNASRLPYSRLQITAEPLYSGVAL